MITFGFAVGHNQVAKLMTISTRRSDTGMFFATSEDEPTFFVSTTSIEALNDAVRIALKATLPPSISMAYKEMPSRDRRRGGVNTLVNCTTLRCGAKFDPSIQWLTGYRDDSSSSGMFSATGKIPLGNCPVCRKAQDAALQKNSGAA